MVPKASLVFGQSRIICCWEELRISLKTVVNDLGHIFYHRMQSDQFSCLNARFMRRKKWRKKRWKSCRKALSPSKPSDAVLTCCRRLMSFVDRSEIYHTWANLQQIQTSNYHLSIEQVRGRQRHSPVPNTITVSASNEMSLALVSVRFLLQHVSCVSRERDKLLANSGLTK